MLYQAQPLGRRQAGVVLCSNIDTKVAMGSSSLQLRFGPQIVRTKGAEVFSLEQGPSACPFVPGNHIGGQNWGACEGFDQRELSSQHQHCPVCYVTLPNTPSANAILSTSALSSTGLRATVRCHRVRQRIGDIHREDLAV